MTLQESKNLVIDLDGTLLKTDSLWELFFKALSEGRLSPFIWLLSGRANFKNRLAQTAALDLPQLPWNQEVLELAAVHHQKGGCIWLATAADKNLAKKIIDHFGFFTGFFASDGIINLKGEAKANELVKHFGEGGFGYAGNSTPDLKVWKSASHAIVIGDRKLGNKVSLINSKVTLLDSNKTTLSTIRSIFKVIRIHQWAKNSLLFVPLIMAHSFSLAAWIQALAAFLTFCFFSSAGYILNDLLDIDSDRRHPEKRLRPFAAGLVDLPFGAELFLLTFLAGMLLAGILGTKFLMLALLYLITTILYSLKLKLLALVDIIILTLLYCIRILAGAVALNLIISQWLLSFSFFVFAALSLIKRLGELRRNSIFKTESNTRRPYGPGDAVFFQILTSGCLCSAVLTLAIYVGDTVALNYYQNPQILLLFCPVLFYWLARLLKLADEGKMSYDPVFFTLKDKISWICLGIGILAYFFATIGF
jgi:4-hydroxybenzoate polyprenyltransferase/phosphoserine phosphatase